MRDLRILCLHGYHGSAVTLRRQMAPLAATLPSTVELVHVDAPSLARGDFGWWHEGFSGWERTRDWVLELLRTGPRFDGLFGFSQGAALTGLLAAYRESDPAAAADLDIDFAIMVGGFTSPFAEHADLFRHKLTLPSAHVIGRSDGIVPRPDSLLLADRFAGPLVIQHPGGHIVPGEPAVTTPIVEFLTGFQREDVAAAPGPVERDAAR